MADEILGSIYYKASQPYQRGISPLARGIKAEQHDLAVVIAESPVKVKQLGNILPTSTRDNPNQGRVYDTQGLSPAITDVSKGGGREPMIVAMRGRNPNNPSDRTAGNLTEQRLEPNSRGICNTLTSVQKDNMLLESVVAIDEQNMRARYETFGTLTTDGSTPKHNNRVMELRNTQYRIRKLTPLECWRLMSFSDGDFHRAAAVSSNSQLYKQAGNSIVKKVLMAIFAQLIKKTEV